MNIHMETCLEKIFVFCSLILIKTAASQSIIETLPGFPGTLPFKLETGYIGVGEKNETQLFYYFIESENDPQSDPLLLWLTGGPGCSAFSGLVFEIGPLSFTDFDGTFPSFTTNPYSWTKIANIIFIDSPVGTGFSYGTTLEGYDSSDTKSANHNYLFLRKWLSIHPTFAKNRLYISGDSYAGKIVPMVALEVAKGNEDGIEPKMFLQGYIVGNAVTNASKEHNEMFPFAHRMALISDEYFETVKSNCHGEYVNPDPKNVQCSHAIRLVQQSYNYVNANVWANDETVREALHIRKGTKSQWIRCNFSLSYEVDVQSVFKYHHLLSEEGFHALVYSGDHDMVVPYMSTLKWIHKLNFTLDENWRPWNVDGQIAGYTMKCNNNQSYLTFATIKGAGHTAPEYKPKESFALIQRWLSSYPL